MIAANPSLKPIIERATKASIKLSEKTIQTSEKAGNFLTDVADVFLFIMRIVKETFSGHFEFKEFFYQHRFSPS